MKRLLLLTLFALTFLQACQKDNFEKFTPDTNQFDNVTASFSGLVVGPTEEGVSGATVTLGTATTSTDEYGYFFFEEVSVPENKAYIQVQKSGYFQGSRTLVVNENHTHQVRIKLLDNTPIGTLDNATGGIINLPQGGSLSFDAGDVADANGNPYSGQVNVAAKRIDPTTTNGQFEMPGDLRATNADGQEIVLQSYGMMAVELTDDAGNELQVAPDQVVDIRFEVPSSLMGTAPATIPLWSFDEVGGEWVQEGLATLSGNTYVGEVSHFSFWNTDAKFPTVYFEATFVDANGNPIPDALIMIELPTGWGTTGMTSNEGWVGGLVKAEETMKLFFLCGDTWTYIQDFTTTTDDIDLGEIVLNDQVTYTVSGSLVDCDDNPVTEGYITDLSSGSWYTNNTYLANEDGSFEFDISRCGISAATFIMTDLPNQMQTNPLDFDLSINSALGEIKVCDVVVETILSVNYVDFSGVSKTEVFTLPDVVYVIDSTGSNNFSISATGQNQSKIFNMYVDGIGVGSFPGEGFFYTTDYEAGFTCTVNITNYTTVPGEYIEGVMVSDGSSPEITGSFKILR